MPPRRGRMHGASIASILNSDARSDEEARRRVLWWFGTILTILFVLDIGCSFIVLWLECDSTDRDNDDDDDETLTATTTTTNTTTISHCIRRSIMDGLPFLHQPDHYNDGSRQGVGDLFLMAILRYVVTTTLLIVGVWYGRRMKDSSDTENMPHEEDETAATTTTTTIAVAESTSTTDEQQQQQQLTEPLLSGNDNNIGGVESQVNERNQGGVRSRCICTTCSTNRRVVQPSHVQNAILLALFVSTTLFQVYAGLRVATRDPHTHEQQQEQVYGDNNSSSATAKTTSTVATIIVVLLCLNVLWINAEAYVFRVLLGELTRDDVVYLPPEVHRHPVYFEKSRGLSLNWCDLCHQRIGGQEGSTASTGCYRCSLCDFDVCLKCVKRNDAATVGENILRGDRGVRAQPILTTTSYFHRSIQVAKQELPLLLVSFLLLGTSSLSQLLLPHFQGSIIDKVVPGPDGKYDREGFKHFIQLYLVLMVVQGAVSTLYSAIFTLVSRRLKFSIRNTLLERILSQDVAFYDGTESGQLLSRLTIDLDLMMSPIQSSLSSLLSNILILFGGLIMCYVKSYRLSMLAFVTVGPISYMWEQYAQWSKGLAREMISFWAQGNGVASQALSNIRTVKAFGCEEQVLGKYSDANKRALDCGIKDAWGNGVTSALTGYLDLGTGVLILYFGGLLVYRGEMSVGELVTFQLFWNMMNNAYQNLQGLITDFTRSAAGAEKVFAMWDSDPDIDPKKGNDVSWDVQGHLKLQDVSYYYQMRPDNIVLNKLSLEVPAGKILALVGRSGGGKSTIINLLLRFYDPKEGKIFLDGREYESLRVNQLRRVFGVVTQETELFPLTIEENIAYGLNKEDYTMEDIVHAAKQACAHDFICEMKDGYQTRIGERGLRISGGQRQRLAIARVFLRRPKIILLDEATSALDEHSQEAVQQALSNLIAECNATVVLVAHRLSTVVNAHSICVIDKGTVLEQGNHEQLLAQGGIYASMVEKQVKKKADLIDQEGKVVKGTAGEHGQTAVDDIDSLLSGN